MTTEVFLTDGCPDCGSLHFYPGPRGGMSVNIKCAFCGSKFNYCGPLPAQRIDNDDQFYQAQVMRRLEEL